MSIFERLQSEVDSLFTEPIENEDQPIKSIAEIHRDNRAIENATKYFQYWSGLPIGEVGELTQKTSQVQIRLYPYGFRGDKTIAILQYRIVRHNVGDREWQADRTWLNLGRLENRKNKIIFFLSPDMDSLPDPTQQIIKSVLKIDGFIHTDTLKPSSFKGSTRHPLLDPRLLKVLKVWVTGDPDPSKPLRVCRDDRQADPYQKMQPGSATISNRSKLKAKRLERENRFLKQKAENLENGIYALQRDPNLKIDPHSGKIVDRWFKIANDQSLQHRLITATHPQTDRTGYYSACPRVEKPRDLSKQIKH